MALNDLYSNLHLLFRWLHVIAGITWIGHLYFFNFVNIPLQGAMDDATKKAVNPKLMPRALWWFRWGAMVTFVMGWILFTQVYMYTPGKGFGPSELFMNSGRITDRAVWILMGMSFATMMWYNVWFKIWPTQKKILSGQLQGDALTAGRALAGKASRMNTYMSGPMLFGMLAPSHYGAVNPLTLVVVIAFGLFAIWAAYNTSKTAGATV
ncbi:MAG TPA: urate hydroxylase PuuD [Verrucomicrobiae bacterium]|jgi:uncharacterized membrane protein|nr:urate hydroxylase PuuD [Verrucomicrobiae bacterium]